jgi:hypothetical protein
MPKYEIKTKERTDILILPSQTLELVDNKSIIEIEESEIDGLEKLGKVAGFSISEIKPKKKPATPKKKGTKKTK